MPRWSRPLPPQRAALALPALLALPITLALSGCEPMAPSGKPFTPVRVQAVAAGAPVAAAADPRFAEFDEEPQSYSSEELRAMAGGAPVDPAATAATPSPDGGSTSAAPTAAAPSAATSAAVGESMGVQAPAVINPAAPLGWAVRLVSTVPMAQPPRAILGLPDGREVVVTPGAMVPEVGLVVLAIGPQAVQLARVQATGDHATVEAIQLAPLY